MQEKLENNFITHVKFVLIFLKFLILGIVWGFAT